MSDLNNPGSSDRPTELEASEVLLLQGDILDELGEPIEQNDDENNDNKPDAISTKGCPGANTPQT